MQLPYQTTSLIYKIKLDHRWLLWSKLEQTALHPGISKHRNEGLFKNISMICSHFELCSEEDDYLWCKCCVHHINRKQKHIGAFSNATTHYKSRGLKTSQQYLESTQYQQCRKQDVSGPSYWAHGNPQWTTDASNHIFMNYKTNRTILGGTNYSTEG